MLGRACGESPLRLESAMQAVELMRRLDPADVTLETMLVLVEALPGRDEDYTAQLRQGEAARQQEAAHLFGWTVARMLRHRAPGDREYYARCKRALIVADWLDGVPTSDIEERFSTNAFVLVGHGHIRGYADGSRFLFESVVRIAAIVLDRADDPDAVAALLRRLDLGVPSGALELTKLPVPLTRGELLALWHGDLRDAGQVAAASEATLERTRTRRCPTDCCIEGPVRASRSRRARNHLTSVIRSA